MEILTWDAFGEAARHLARRVTDDGYRPDLVLAIARGGLLLGGTMGYQLGVKNVHVINVEFYTGVDERLPMPVMLPPTPPTVDLADKRILIVDDVADTGETLKLVHDYCAAHVAEARSAVVYEKSRSVIKTDYFWKRTDDWIDFPWSSRLHETA